MKLFKLFLDIFKQKTIFPVPEKAVTPASKKLNILNYEPNPKLFPFIDSRKLEQNLNVDFTESKEYEVQFHDTPDHRNTYYSFHNHDEKIKFHITNHQEEFWLEKLEGTLFNFIRIDSKQKPFDIANKALD